MIVLVLLFLVFCLLLLVGMVDERGMAGDMYKLYRTPASCRVLALSNPIVRGAWARDYWACRSFVLSRSQSSSLRLDGRNGMECEDRIEKKNMWGPRGVDVLCRSVESRSYHNLQ
ncbi:hypothetical protein DFH07DRAFT_137943 [Mycena maculata]|uniref:Secreted protein n=1 Tax=Mycena maculata TaxID=230809 RepID=A0AAD7I220_9AGAR|nr:hypothetical protein DFH07DRAFT_137943 [Mycena maculata]